MNKRSNLCRDLAHYLASELSTAVAGSQTAIDQASQAMGVETNDGFIAALKDRHGEVLVSLAEEMEVLYARTLEASTLTLEELHGLVQFHDGPLPSKVGQVMLTLLGSEEMQQLMEKVNAEMLNFCERYEEEEAALCG
ncbi:hypothetical protein AYO44_13770 [Planctomycetaceae bacterium SCGC AG-212-F19]|nr:hypothetical protein AYO44_13770 [Planctomycetaceae bacterium SCGC AG-212-F19]